MSLPSRRSGSYKPKNFWLGRVKHLVKVQSTRFPLLKPFMIRAWRSGKLLLLRGRQLPHAIIGTWTGTYSRDIDVDKTHWISPHRIIYSSLQEFNIHDYKGHVLGGDWDCLEKRFEDLDVYIAMQQVCLEGKTWTETVFYQRVLDELNAGHILWGCKNESDFEHRCQDLESLFLSIRQDGYKSQRELLQSQQVYNPLRADEEVIVNIGRNGDLLFSDGAHRLTIAKLLKIEKIPVKVAVRHQGWVKFRQELQSYVKELGGKPYQAITHPDLNDIAAVYDCESRFTLIKESICNKAGRLLDIGANLGYFCHKFEDEGFDCYALEDSPVHFSFLEKLKRAENKHFKTINTSALKCREIRCTSFEVVLALNVFHRFLETKESYDEFSVLLKNLQTKVLFFEPPRPTEPQKKGTYQHFSAEEFVEFLSENSNLKQAELIGVTKDESPLYKLF